MKKELFREVSLERLSSPEQLDTMIKVTSPRGWLILLAIGCILMASVYWSLFGSLPSKIIGQGILLRDGGVFYLKHHTQGQITNIRHSAGDMVNKGDVIARIEVPELVTRINELEAGLRTEAANQGADSQQYQQLKDQILEHQEELIFKSQIISPISGRIIEINMENGSIISPGDSLVIMEQHGEAVKLEAVLYVAAGQGGDIKPGMEVHLSPANVNKEEYGFMLGRVMSVSEFPATSLSMLQTLGNENLVKMLATQGASLMVKVDLLPDSSTVSGYQWSSPTGPQMVMHSGTIVEGSIITKREKPINKVLPIFR